MKEQKLNCLIWVPLKPAIVHVHISIFLKCTNYSHLAIVYCIDNYTKYDFLYVQT